MRHENEPELEGEEWRYRVETPGLCVVISFTGEENVRCVTAWEKGSRR